MLIKIVIVSVSSLAFGVSMWYWLQWKHNHTIMKDPRDSYLCFEDLILILLVTSVVMGVIYGS